LKQILAITFLMTLVMGLSAPTLTEATLYDRGGGLIYDDYSDITWMQDANYAKTIGAGWGNGYMSWFDAKTWVANLVYYDPVRKVYLDNWRLPTAYNRDGVTTCIGYNCTESEMGHLYYVDLGNIAGGPLTSTGPFSNLEGKSYWLGEPENTYPFWEFNFNKGWQGLADCHIAWPVFDGDVKVGDSGSIPEPSTIILLGAGVLGLAGLRRKRN